MNSKSFDIDEEILKPNQIIHENNLRVLSRISTSKSLCKDNVKHIETNDYDIDLYEYLLFGKFKLDKYNTEEIAQMTISGVFMFFIGLSMPVIFEHFETQNRNLASTQSNSS